MTAPPTTTTDLDLRSWIRCMVLSQPNAGEAGAVVFFKLRHGIAISKFDLAGPIARLNDEIDFPDPFIM